MMNTTWSRVLRGCAYGDGWGNTNEFKSYRALTAQSRRGPHLPERLVITDDTQMTLSLARALNGATDKTDDQLRNAVVREFVIWLDDPEDPIDALRRATVTNGDSDSIAAVTGAILGALHRDPWPKEWADRLEPRYRGWIAEAEQYDFDGSRS